MSTYKSPKGYHRHRCDKCHHIWEHSDEMAGVTKAHRCPKCKRENWFRYLGPLAPVVSILMSCFKYH